VWDWCASWSGKGYPYQLEDEWQSAYLEADQPRILRGGSWHDEQKYARASSRLTNLPRYRSINYSLRVASYAPLPGSES
ncbi:MAG: hypothetical protein EOM24_24550, partial [Chloroflexia bacterium]|nr:hypothetical protein [Chloroflexia bacterium]